MKRTAEKRSDRFDIFVGCKRKKQMAGAGRKKSDKGLHRVFHTCNRMRSVKDDGHTAVSEDVKACGEACVCEPFFDSRFADGGQCRFYRESGLSRILRLYRTEHAQCRLHGAGKQRAFET